MTVKKPSVWKQPLGNSADTQELVESSSEEASFNGLFPEIMEKSLADGGYPPKRTEFNALFKDIGEHLYYHQIGGTSEYSESTEYPVNAVVTYNNELYKAVKTSTGQTPTNTNYWVKLATADDLSSLDVGDTYLPLYGGELFSYSSTPELAYSTSGNVVTDEKVYTGTDEDYEKFTVSSIDDTLTFVNERYSKKVELSSIKYTSDIDLKVSFTDADGWIWYAFLGATGNIKTVVLDTTADDRVSWHLASEQTIVSDAKPTAPLFDVVNEVKNVIISSNSELNSSASFTLYKVCNCYTAKIDFKEPWNAELVKKYREDIASNTKSISEISETVENLSNSGDFVTVDKDQDITGTKTFVDDALKVNLTSIDTTGDVTDTVYGGIALTDKAKDIKGVLGLSLNSDKEIKTVLKSQNDTNTAEISVTVDSTGVGKAYAPSSLNGTDTAQIATIDTVDDVKTKLSSSISDLATNISSLSKTRAGDIGVAGDYGFGVGIFPGTQKELDDLGLSPMSGYDDPYNANYGNYMHKTAGVVVFIPKFYVRYGSSSSPNYSKYGQNAVDVASAYDFADDESAKKSGYFLHRAFYDDGKEKDGFFIGKYEASAGASNSSPMSVVSQTGMNNIQYWYFIQYARNIGYGWNCATCFMHGALEVLMQAHGQASTYDSNYENLTYYISNNAWYDSTGSANHPTRGYWSTDNTDIGIHAHNGQKCGVFGFHAHWQVGWGITTPGSSSTDTSTYSSNTLYVLKRSAKFADMTEGWNGSVGTNDIWGTASFLSGKNYQVETSPWDHVTYSSSYYEGWSDGKARWTCSNGSATDYSSLTETEQNMFSVISKGYSGTTPTGTNLWDNSNSYFALYANSTFLFHGIDGNSAWGVFSRAFAYSRTDSDTTNSFRFAGFVS